MKSLSYSIAFVIAGCFSPQHFYHGVICNEQLQPVAGVTVRAEMNAGRSAVTDDRGYFRMGNDGIVNTRLIVSKQGYRSDTVATIGSNHGEAEVQAFSGQKPDTLILYPVPGG